MSLSEKMYRLLLRAYPRAYRDQYARPMEQLFRGRLREVNGSVELAALWMRTLADWVVSLPARYWERLVPHAHVSPFAPPARRGLFYARMEASSFSRREITAEHLLLGVVRQSRLLSPTATEAVVCAIEANEPAGRRIPPMEDLPLSDQAIRVINTARQVAHTAGRQHVSPADLVTGIQREADTLAARLLHEHLSNRS